METSENTNFFAAISGGSVRSGNQKFGCPVVRRNNRCFLELPVGEATKTHCLENIVLVQMRLEDTEAIFLLC